MNTPFGNSITTAEHAIALMLALARADSRRPTPRPRPASGRRTASWASRSPARRSASSAAAISARSSPTARTACKMKVIAFDPFLSPERAARSRRREGRARRAVPARRFHHAAHAAHRQDQEHHRRGGAGEDEEGRAHHQLRARRAGRRGGAARGARFRPGRGRRLRRVRRGAGDREPAVRPSPTSCARRISAPRPPRRRRTSRCRSPSRCRTICCAARSPTRSTFPRSPPRRRRSCKPFIELAEKLGSFAGQLTESGISKVQLNYEGAVAQMKTKALTSAALAGLLRPMLQDVNVVSAPIVAKERGIVVEETTREAQGDYESLITVTVVTERQTRSVSGTVFADGRPRIVKIKGIRMEAEFGPSMLYVTNEDKPGFIGRFASTPRRRRHQHRDLPPRPQRAGRRRHRAGRGRRRRARRSAQAGAGTAACPAGEAAAVLICDRVTPLRAGCPACIIVPLFRGDLDGPGRCSRSVSARNGSQF